jgi:hypothetical protein
VKLRTARRFDVEQGNKPSDDAVFFSRAVQSVSDAAHGSFASPALIQQPAADSLWPPKQRCCRRNLVAILMPSGHVRLCSAAEANAMALMPCAVSQAAMVCGTFVRRHSRT